MVYSQAEHLFILEHNFTPESFAAVCEAFSSVYPDKEVLNNTTIHQHSAHEHTVFHICKTFVQLA
jgi:hypothetical protein